MKNLTFTFTTCLAITLCAPLAMAQMPSAASAESAKVSTDMADGEVRKVDKENKKITLRHGVIKNLDMPAMTMVFQVKDAALLDKVKTGDKVKFTADKVGGTFTVLSMEPQP